MKLLLTIAIFCLIITMTIITVNAETNPADWQHVATITGSTDQTTDYFTIPTKDWRITWSCTNSSTYSLFSVWVHPKNSSVSTISAFFNLHNENQGVEYISNYKPDEYYLNVTATEISSYTITIDYYIAPTPRQTQPAITILIIDNSAIAILIVACLTLGLTLVYVTRGKKQKPPSE